MAHSKQWTYVSDNRGSVDEKRNIGVYKIGNMVNWHVDICRKVVVKYKILDWDWNGLKTFKKIIKNPHISKCI